MPDELEEVFEGIDSMRREVLELLKRKSSGAFG